MKLVYMCLDVTWCRIRGLGV